MWTIRLEDYWKTVIVREVDKCRDQTIEMTSKLRSNSRRRRVIILTIEEREKKCSAGKLLVELKKTIKYTLCCSIRV